MFFLYLYVLRWQRIGKLSKSLNVHGDKVGGKLVLGDVQERAVVRVVDIHLYLIQFIKKHPPFQFSDIIFSHLWSRHCERHYCTVVRYRKQTHVLLLNQSFNFGKRLKITLSTHSLGTHCS